MLISWLMSQAKHIFCTKMPSPDLDLSSSKADAQTSRQFIKKKKKTRTTGCSKNRVIKLMMWHLLANKKPMMWTFLFLPVYG